MRRQPQAQELAQRPPVWPRVLGIDASLSSTGYAYQVDGKLITGRVTTDKLRGTHRLVYLRNQLERVIALSSPTLIVYEDYAMGARGNNMFHIGELGGVLKALIWEKGVDLLLVPPTTMKSVIAFSGRAEKTDIIKALQNRFGFSVSQHDEADAAGLMIVGEILKGTRRVADEPTRGGRRSDAVFQLTITKGQLQSISFSAS